MSSTRQLGSPGQCCIPWYICEFQCKFDQIFAIAMNFVFPQFSHLLTIHTLQTLVWTQYVCWLRLHSLFPFRKKYEIERKTYMSLPSLSCPGRKLFSEWRITDWKLTWEIQKWREGICKSHTDSEILVVSGKKSQLECSLPSF